MIDEWKLKYYCFSFFIIIKIKGKIIFYENDMEECQI